MSNPSYQRWKNIMKCVPFEERRLLKWQPPFIIQPKYDGVRCRAIPSSLENVGHLLVSSEENIIYSVPHLNRMLSDLRINAELDGELYCHGKSFEEIYSITSRTTNLHPNFLDIQFHVFDVVNELPQMKRLILLEALKGIHRNLRIAPFWLCEDLDEVTRTFDVLIQDGYEGIIVRNFEAPYERKRSTWVMKFKPKKSDEYIICGYEEEISKDGIPKNRLGALWCESGNGEKFKVGTGFNDEQRQQLWDIRGLLSGMTCLVKYQHITSGRGVPRFPVFAEIVGKVN